MLGFGAYDLYVNSKSVDKLDKDLKEYCKNEKIDTQYFKYLLTLVKRK